jgi:hypothetical protein
MIEKLVIKEMCTILGGFQNKLDTTTNHAFGDEIFDPDNSMDYCNRCNQRSNHKLTKDLCVMKTSLGNLTGSFFANKISQRLVDLFAGILIGSKYHAYGESPIGLYRLLNLSCNSWSAAYCTGFHCGVKIIFCKSGLHQILNPEDDFFLHAQRVVEKLPENYTKPIFLEFFLNEEQNLTDEFLEMEIECFVENVVRLRETHPRLFIILGPNLRIKTSISSPSAYEEASRYLRKIEYILTCYCLKMQIPLVLTQGIINNRPINRSGQTLWTQYEQNRQEPLYDTMGHTTREYVKRVSVAIDLAMEAYQLALRKLTSLIRQRTEMNSRPMSSWLIDTLSRVETVESNKRKSCDDTAAKKKLKTETSGQKKEEFKEEPTSTTTSSAKIIHKEGLKMTFKLEEVKEEVKKGIQETEKIEHNEHVEELDSDAETVEYLPDVPEDDQEDNLDLPVPVPAQGDDPQLQKADQDATQPYDPESQHSAHHTESR